MKIRNITRNLDLLKNQNKKLNEERHKIKTKINNSENITIETIISYDENGTIAIKEPVVSDSYCSNKGIKSSLKDLRIIQISLSKAIRLSLLSNFILLLLYKF